MHRPVWITTSAGSLLLIAGVRIVSQWTYKDDPLYPCAPKGKRQIRDKEYFTLQVKILDGEWTNISQPTLDRESLIPERERIKQDILEQQEAAVAAV